MLWRAVPVCFLHFVEGLWLTFSHICGTTGQTTVHSSGSGPLVPSPNSPRRTSMMGRSTDPVGGEDTRIKMENPRTEKEEKDSSGGCCCVIV